MGGKPTLPSVDPLRTSLGRLKRFGEVPSVSPHLPVAQLDDLHNVKYPPVAVVDNCFDDPQSHCALRAVVRAVLRLTHRISYMNF